MLPAQLDSVDEGHLNALVTNGVPESRSLEFKAKLVWGTESERKEFLADVSAFANAGGGDLVLGIEEDNVRHRRSLDWILSIRTKIYSRWRA